jgi:hypothetical protein
LLWKFLAVRKVVCTYIFIASNVGHKFSIATNISRLVDLKGELRPEILSSKIL